MLITEQEIKAQIHDIKCQISVGGLTPSELTSLKERLEIKNICLRYIQTNPSEDFVIKQIQQLTDKIERRMNLFKEPDPDKFMQKVINKLRKEHEKEHGVPELRKQLSVVSSLIKIQ